MGSEEDPDDDLLPGDSDAVLQESGRTVPQSRRGVGYAVYGDPDGDPVVLSHPTPGTRAFGRLLADDAAAVGVRLVVPERPGYGLTPSRTVVGPFTTSLGIGDVTSQVWVVSKVVDALAIEEYGVLGFSSGCPFALAVAAEDPHSVTDVALVSATTPPDGPGDDVPLRPRAAELAREKAGRDDEGEPPDRQSAPRDGLHLGSTPAEWLAVGAAGLTAREAASVYGDPEAAGAAAPTIRRELLLATEDSMPGFSTERSLLARGWGVRFDAVETTPIALHGDEDPHAPPDAGRYLGRRLGAATLGVLEGHGHLSTLLAAGETALRHAAPSLTIDLDPSSRDQT
jgi:pimeloyl-ACP methyl ester carboxylesterase